MEIGFAIVAFIAVAIVIRFIAGSFDHDRVRRYVESNGGTFLKGNWAPFGPGWFGSQDDRIYEVRYLDRDQNEHVAYCKTSMSSGVYFTEDRIVRYAKRAAERDEMSLEQENRRLREEVERLKRSKS